MASRMSCVSCSVQFTLFKRKNRCTSCRLLYCTQCFRKGEGLPRRNVKHCLKCHTLSSYPFVRSELMLLTVKELKSLIEREKVSAAGCTEKRDLVDVIINHQTQGEDNTLRMEHSPARTHETEPIPSTSSQPQSSASSRSPTTSSHQASQGMNNFFGFLGDHPDIQRYVQSFVVLDDNGLMGVGAPDQRFTFSGRERNDAERGYARAQNAPSAKVGMQSNRISIDSFQDVGDIKKLSAKDLKSILDDNFVDYKGCVEKSELLQRAVLLWESRQQQKASASGGSENMQSDELCKVCMDRCIDCVLLECGHLVTCIECGRQLGECPMCRQNIARIVRVFKS